MKTTPKIRIGFAVELVFALGIVALSYRATGKLLGTNRLVARANVAITNLEGAVEALNNLERSHLAWVAAGIAMHNLRARRFQELACGTCHSRHTRPVEAERFRHTHLEMINDLTRQVEKLRTFIASEPAQQERFRLLESNVQKKAAAARDEIPTRDIESFSESPEALAADSHLTGDIQSTIAAMQKAESDSLARQVQERAANARSEMLAVGMLGLLTICTSVVANVIINRDLARRKALEGDLFESLRHKDALLQELHHRVKNNLQLICSLLSLQTRGVADEGTRGVLWEAETRVRSMALVHEKLYYSGDLLSIDFGDYVRALADQLLQSYGSPPHRVRVTVNGSTVHLDVDRAMLCGMIISELVTNALRHAFPQRDGGEVEVSLEPSGIQLILAVRDNGMGMPANRPPESGRTLGLSLVRMLTKQLKGTVEMRPTQGTEFVITFPQVAA
ncbi:MAG: ATP-binding protein [Acidobacteriia bacterium]|nr:ATP-binding protein [Terriglobia bacterium]